MLQYLQLFQGGRIMKTILRSAITLTALLSSALGAQSSSAVRLQLAPNSQLSFEGTSTLHGFTCTTSTMQAYIDVDAAYKTESLATVAHPIVAVQIIIPVKSLSCGGELESNMGKTLNSTKFPYIIYKLSNYDVAAGTASTSAFTATTQGTLTIAGAEHPVALTVKASRATDGVVSATGAQTIKMSDYGVKPPTFMLGTLRVGNDLKVKFTVNATSAAVASAMSELNHKVASAQVAGFALDTPKQ
ncbi:MAG: YceI family protein [Gemmatimonadaceae bacterium]